MDRETINESNMEQTEKQEKSLLTLKVVPSRSDSNSVTKYHFQECIGKGAFGNVFRATCSNNEEVFAIKKVFQDQRYKNRELQILKELDNPNIILLKDYFYMPSEQPNELYLCVVMDYIPNSLYNVIKNLTSFKAVFSKYEIKLISYQLIKSLSYLEAVNICHRDIKPQNILIETDSHIVKICDFGSAKKLIKGEVNISYICSRYYRAPELIFGATNYTNSVDVWSVGCVLAELILLEPIFQGESTADQIMEIIKILGTPSKQDILEMNPEYNKYKFPIVKCFTYKEIFKDFDEPLFFNLLSKMLIYSPKNRISPLEALRHSYFDEVRETNKNSLQINDILFSFSNEEYIRDTQNIIKELIPDWYSSKEYNR